MSKLEWATVSAVAAIIALLVILALNSNAVKSKSDFTVVDTYKGCDVLRYTEEGGAKYHYFLDCNPKEATK